MRNPRRRHRRKSPIDRYDEGSYQRVIRRLRAHGKSYGRSARDRRRDRRRHNPYAAPTPADWSSWRPNERASWRRRNWIARAGGTPRSFEQRVAARRLREVRGRRNPRHPFIAGNLVHLHARWENQERREREARWSEAKKRAITGRLPAIPTKRNPRYQFIDKAEMYGRARRRSRYRQWRTYLGMDQHPHRTYAARRNPKRDGTPTRGERKAGRYKDHLRAIRQRGEHAAQELRRLLGRSTGPAVLTAEKTETQRAHPGHYAPEMSSDQRFVQEQVGRIDATMAEVRDRIRGLGDADEELADQLSGQMAALAKQRKALLAGSGLTEGARSNPGRSPRARRHAPRFRPAARVSYRRALLHYCTALTRC
jgi:hypothetical protein